MLFLTQTLKMIILEPGQFIMCLEVLGLKVKSPSSAFVDVSSKTVGRR